jgi:hypothetical protein
VALVALIDRFKLSGLLGGAREQRRRVPAELIFLCLSRIGASSDVFGRNRIASIAT